MMIAPNSRARKIGPLCARGKDPHHSLVHRYGSLHRGLHSLISRGGSPHTLPQRLPLTTKWLGVTLNSVDSWPAWLFLHRAACAAIKVSLSVATFCCGYGDQFSSKHIRVRMHHETFKPKFQLQNGTNSFQRTSEFIEWDLVQCVELHRYFELHVELTYISIFATSNFTAVPPSRGKILFVSPMVEDLFWQTTEYFLFISGSELWKGSGMKQGRRFNFF